MSNLITTEHINQIQFYQMPKAFFRNPKYLLMRNDSKLAYMLIRDLLSLSIENNWVNENNEVFVKMPREKLMSLLNIKGTQKFSQVMKELVDYGLIIYKCVGLTKCNEIYIYNIEDTTITPQGEQDSNAQRCDNQTHIKTNTNNTNTINIIHSIKDTKEIEEESEELEKVNDLIKDRLHIEYLHQIHDPEFVDEIINNICEMYFSKATRIGHDDKPQTMIRAVISKLEMYHIEHVIGQFKNAAMNYEIYNPKRYLQNLIYNSICEATAKIKAHIRYNMGYW